MSISALRQDVHGLCTAPPAMQTTNMMYLCHRGRPSKIASAAPQACVGGGGGAFPCISLTGSFVRMLCAQAGMPKLSVAEKDALLPRLVRERWLARTPRQNGHYSIGVGSHLSPACEPCSWGSYWSMQTCQI